MRIWFFFDNRILFPNMSIGLFAFKSYYGNAHGDVKKKKSNSKKHML